MAETPKEIAQRALRGDEWDSDKLQALARAYLEQDKRLADLSAENADLRRRNRDLDIVQAHDRWAREGQESALLTLRNTLETFRAEMG